MERRVEIAVSRSSEQLEGSLSLPSHSKGLVIFAHGSGSSATSIRNQIVARILNENGFGTLLFDLLTEEEQEADRRAQSIVGKVPGITFIKFNIKLLTNRLDVATRWIQNQPDTKNFRIGYFGSSTGAAAALYAAASFHNVKAVACRSGRTDLVEGKTLQEIKCPSLFIVGGNDKKVIRINKETINQLVNVSEKKLEVVKGASHLFEEEGKIEVVANLSSEWFDKYLG